MSESDAKQLDSMRGELARELTERHFAAHPELRERFGPIGYQKGLEDAAYHFRYLIESLSADEPRLFAEYIGWARVMLEARNVPAADLVRNLELIPLVIRERAGAPLADLCRTIVDAAISALDDAVESVGFPDPAAPHGELAAAYLLRSDRRAAASLVTNAYGAGQASIREHYLHVFQPVQYEICRLWQVNAITVADEHFCTAATQAIMSQFYPDLFAQPKIGRTLVMASIGGELHEIGGRMVADIFELEGWSTWFYGANTPAPSLISAICERTPDVVGLSVTMTWNVQALADFVRAMRTTSGCSGARVIVGGYPFRIAPNLWQQVGADAYAADALEAVDVARRLLEVR
jgi:MerR family transcriptional regulator, light-induced transcriptional regulator